VYSPPSTEWSELRAPQGFGQVAGPASLAYRPPSA